MSSRARGRPEPGGPVRPGRTDPERAQQGRSAPMTQTIDRAETPPGPSGRAARRHHPTDPARHPRRAAAGALVRSRGLADRRRARPRRAGSYPVHPRRAPDHVPRQGLDDAPVRRLRQSAGHQRALSVPARPGTDGPLGRLRHADAHGSTTRTSRIRSARSAAAASPSTRWRTCSRCSAASTSESVTTSMTINSPAPILFAMYLAAADERGIPYREARRDAAERHPQGVHRPEGVHLPDPAVDAARHRRGRVLHAQRPELEPDLHQRVSHPRGREAPRRRSWRSRSPTVSPTWRRGSLAASTSTSSLRGCRSSSTRTSTSSRRSPSTAPPGASGRGTCASSTAPRTSVRSSCASTPRQPDARSPRSRSRTTSPAPPSRRWPRCSAAPTRCTPTPWTRCLRCPPRRRRRSRCARSRSSPTRPGVPSVVDPLAGSWFVEDLTNRMEQAAEDYFAAIAERGGMIARHRRGLPAARDRRRRVPLSEPARDRRKSHCWRQRVRAERRQRPASDAGHRSRGRGLAGGASQARCARRRDNTSVATRLDALQEIARGSDNMMPAIIDCVRARATEGEIVEALREVFGTHRETPVF